MKIGKRKKSKYSFSLSFLRITSIRPDLKYSKFIEAIKKVSPVFVLVFSIFYILNSLSVTNLSNVETVYGQVSKENNKFTEPISNKVLGVSVLSSKKNSSGAIAEDIRIYILEKYFEANTSPLVGTGKLFVEACDKYNAPADCISVAAIAKHETNLCKYNISAKQHNCWGWGGGGEYRRSFSSFAESIDEATRVLATQYGPEYMMDPRKMETVFCGTQDECINWGNRILFFMRELDNFSANLGLGIKLTDFNPEISSY